MRIAYVTAAGIPSRAANAVQTVKMCAAFASFGHRVCLICREGDEPTVAVYERYNVPPNFQLCEIRERGPRGTHVANFINDVRSIMREMGPFDMLFSRDLYCVAGLIGYGIPTMFEAHQVLRDRFIDRLLFKLIVRRNNFKRLVVISDALKGAFVDSHPTLKPDRILVARSAADIVPRNFATKDIGGRDSAMKIGYIGHLYEGRGVDILCSIAGRVPDIDVHVVGGRDADINRWRLADVPKNVFFHGYVPHAVVGDYLARFEVLLAPYQDSVSHAGHGNIAEVFSPMKLFEYMAAAKPIICSDLPVLREILESEVNALLVRPSDIDGWVAAVVRLKNDQSLRQRLASEARLRFIEGHTWEARASRILASL